MSPLDSALVRRKLAVIAANVRDLAAMESLSLEEYRGDRIRLKATERLLQELVDAAADVNLHVVRVHGRQATADYFESFIAVGEAGVIPQKLAAELAPAAGLRNRLVHEYDRLDDDIVLRAVRDARRLFPRYVAAVEAFVQSEEAGD
jgi:uncharacterized protein YutE (UPF0331/DUF86 family)